MFLITNSLTVLTYHLRTWSGGLNFIFIWLAAYLKMYKWIRRIFERHGRWGHDFLL